MLTPTLVRAAAMRSEKRAFAHPRRAGFSLIEVLVALVITLVGLLGLTGLITRANQSEMESYQRVQALMLLQDMVDRINANRQIASCYSNGATGNTLGTVTSGVTPVLTCTTGTAQQNAQVGKDLTAWNNMLQGSAEVSGTSKIGAMIGARGCIVQINAANNTYAVSVAWQGLAPTAAPGNLCGQSLYGSDDKYRRVVAATLRIGKLS